VLGMLEKNFSILDNKYIGKVMKNIFLQERSFWTPNIYLRP